MDPIRVNSAKYESNAVVLIIKHMIEDRHDAASAEVFDQENGRLYAVVRKGVTGNMEILFKRK
jgi:hypothetical protein